MGYILYDRFKEIVALTTDCEGGCSLGHYTSFNMAYHVGDDNQLVYLNRSQLCAYLNIPTKQLICAAQHHTDAIKKVDKSFLGSGEKDFASGVKDVDALYTYDRDLALGVFHADCVPVFIYVPSKHLIGIIHAGMEGTLKEITLKSLHKMIEDEGLNAEDIYIHLGPSICVNHYEIGAEVVDKILKLPDYMRQGLIYMDNKPHLDVALLNIIQAKMSGIPASHITKSPLCTYEDSHLYSYRRDHTTGRHLSVIKFK